MVGQPDSTLIPANFIRIARSRFNGRVQTSKVAGSTQNGSLRPPRIDLPPQLISRIGDQRTKRVHSNFIDSVFHLRFTPCQDKSTHALSDTLVAR